MNITSEDGLEALRNNLCCNIKTLRLKNKYTQSFVAQYLKIDRTTYTYYELCRTCPNILAILQLSKLYGVSIDTIISEKI